MAACLAAQSAPASGPRDLENDGPPRLLTLLVVEGAERHQAEQRVLRLYLVPAPLVDLGIGKARLLYQAVHLLGRPALVLLELFQ